MPIWVLVLDYVLGIIMWTLIGRSAMNIFQREDSNFFFMKAFVNLTKAFIKKKFESSLWKIFIADLPIKVHIIIPRI